MSDTESTQLGTQVHASIEEYCKRLSEGYEWTVAEAEHLVEENLGKRTIKFEPEVDEDLIEKHKQMMKGFVSGDGDLAKLLQTCDVLAQELEFCLPFKLPFKVDAPDGSAFDCVVLNGFIDLVLKDRTTGGIIVVDHKTSKKVFDSWKLKKNLQLPIYSLIINHVYGRLPERCCYYFTRFDKIQDVEPLAINDEVAKKVYFKSGARKGQLKSKQRTILEIEDELTKIFKAMYVTRDYVTKPTALCSWCDFGYYGDIRCDEAQFYKRNDVEVPKENIVII